MACLSFEPIAPDPSPCFGKHDLIYSEMEFLFGWLVRLPGPTHLQQTHTGTTFLLELARDAIFYAFAEGARS